VADECGALDFTCKAKAWAGSAIGDAISSLADGVMEAFGHAIGALGTIWVRIGTPNLTGGATVVPAGEPPGTAGIDTVLGYAAWIAFGVAVLGLITAGVRLALSRSGQTQAVERIGVVLIAVILISASVGIVTALLTPGRTASPTVSFLQNSLWYYTLAVAVLGVIVAGARMAWEQRADPGKHLVQGLLTLVVVAGAGLTVVALLTSAADAFSVWILNNSLNCNIAAGDGTCFGENMFQLLALTSGTTGGMGAVLAIILGVFAVFAALAQVMLMIVRAGALVILAGMLPITAAASLTDPQRTMFRKTSAWLLGFILYKPAAAIVYAAAFRLSGSDLFGDDGLVTVLTGLALMVLALVALPALMRLIVPAVSAVSGGGSLAGLGLAGAAAALPTGAAAASRLTGGTNGSSGSAGPTGSAGTAGTAGAGASSSGAASSGGAAAAGVAPPVAAASAAMTAASAAGRAARTAGETATGGGPDGAV